MQYSEGTIGRIFTIRLEEDERVPDCIEQFAKEHAINSAVCYMIGGIDGGNIVVGPEDGDSPTVTPMLHTIMGAHEAAAIGTIFPDEDDEPILHMHAAMGRDGVTRAGCVRPGIDVWLVGELVIMEILGTDMIRKVEQPSGFKLLNKK